MNRYLLIDGYNVINTWSKLSSMEFSSLEEARDALIEELIEYKWYTGEDVSIIFDAYLVKGNPGSKRYIGGVEVVFTKENQTADTYIEKKVGELMRNRKNHVRVATSDWAEQQMVLGIGAMRLSAREFVIELESVRKSIIKKTKKMNRTGLTVGERIDAGIARKLEKWRKNP